MGPTLLNSPSLPYSPTPPLPYPPPQAVFEDSELKVVRAIRPAGIAILGFKPAGPALAPRHVLDVSRFVHPDERRLRGSTVAFKALHHAMLAQVVGGAPGMTQGRAGACGQRRHGALKASLGGWLSVGRPAWAVSWLPPLPPSSRQDKVAIARVVMRTGNAPQLVALEAQPELALDDGTQVGGTPGEGGARLSLVCSRRPCAWLPFSLPSAPSVQHPQRPPHAPAARPPTWPPIGRDTRAPRPGCS